MGVHLQEFAGVDKIFSNENLCIDHQVEIAGRGGGTLEMKVNHLSFSSVASWGEGGGGSSGKKNPSKTKVLERHGSMNVTRSHRQSRR